MNRFIKNSQNYLLLHYPLIWNTKLVPMLVVAFAMHLLNFVVGYFSGIAQQVGFQILQVLVFIIILVVWFIQYGRQNAFLSFYKKSNYALFYEWIQIAIILTALFTYNCTFNIGNQLGLRATYSKTQILDIGKTLDQAYFFINDKEKSENSFNKPYFKDNCPESNCMHDTVKSVYFKNKKYDLNSVINKKKYVSFDPEFIENDRNTDYISNEFIDINHYKNQNDKVRNWLYDNKKDSVKNMMQKVFVLLQNADLTKNTNLSVDKWLELSYHYPDFKTKEPILNSEYLYNEYKYNLPLQELTNTYRKYYNAHKFSLFSQSNLLFICYLVLAFSLLIFTFRISSLNDWIMSLVYALMLGILGVLFGILVSNFIKTSSIAFCYLAIVFTCCMVYFLQIMHKKVNKKLSSRALNLILWMLPTLLPALWETNVKDYFLEDYISIDLIFTINVVITVFCIFSLCIAIKKWKGIAVQ